MMLSMNRAFIAGVLVLAALASVAPTSHAWSWKKQCHSKSEAGKKSVPQAADVEALPHVYAAFSPAILASSVEVSETQKAMIGEYIESQVATNGFTIQQFTSMTPVQQRRVLTPGRQTFTREERREMQLQVRQASIPNYVQQAIIPLAVLDQKTVTKYGVALPTVVQTNLKVPNGISMVLFGNKLAALSHSGTILSVVEEIY